MSQGYKNVSASLGSELSGLAIDHIGVAVPSIDVAMKFYLDLGLPNPGLEEVAREKVKVAMFQLDNQAKIELLEATVEDSTIAQFIKKRGPGIHHICLRVPDVRAKLAELKAKGYRLVHEEPFMGAHNCMVAFVHPSSTGGVLIELSQKMNTGAH